MTVFAEAASGIGRTLVGEALWHEDRCTWLGATCHDGPAPRYATLVADLYAGVAGVGLFLAHLAEVTGDREIRRAAEGAIRQALWRVEHRPAESEDGLYAGLPGIALAAVRAGAALGDEGLQERGRRLARDRPAGRGDGELDVLAGAAGRIIALLAMRAELGEAAVEAARASAGELLDRAGEVRQTGYSHGLSGVTAALLELWAVTGEDALRRAAEACMASEREYLDPREGNWADLETPGGGGRRTYFVNWCQGAPGIGLVRLRATELTGVGLPRAEALVALRTTDRYARAALGAQGFDLSPCHGLSGLAEVLAEGERVLGEAWPGGRAVALQVAEAAVERHGAGDAPWPCGVPLGEPPGLMIGLSGIGLFLLRLHDPTIPSALQVRSPG